MTGLQKILIGRGSFASPANILENLSLQDVSSKPHGMPHSIYEEVWHLVFWQRWIMSTINKENPSMPEHAEESWPEESAPPDLAAWNELLEAYINGLTLAQEVAGKREMLLKDIGSGYTIQDMLGNLAVHNAYHLGQIVLLRQLAGQWPPPSGGMTW